MTEIVNDVAMVFLGGAFLLGSVAVAAVLVAYFWPELARRIWPGIGAG